ncbi:MAG TPA: hypothetical protein VHL59_07470 [Thermoanaerobaculia bacterium]|nr:hypothetical protein [Thermoanaerobaculia bacterium]
MLCLLALAVFASGMALSRGAIPASEIDNAFTAFQSEIEKELVASRRGSDTQLRQHAAETYERLFRKQLTRAKLDDLSSADLDLIHRAAEIAGTYAIEERHARDMVAILDELSRRGDATKLHYSATYRMLVAVRDFAGARRLAAKYPAEEFEVLPTVRADPDPAKGPSVWTLSDDKNEVVRRRVEMDTGPRIVVVSHPLCHFSRNAVSAIAADDVLGAVFRSYATWIAPQSGTLNLPRLQQWNREHRHFEVALVVRQTEWTFVDYWNTPTFYFLRDGAVVQKVIGWPKEGRREDLLSASRKAGILQ